jgi:hypothetical protein
MIVTADERNAIIDVLHRVAFGFDQRKLDMVEASFAENATMSMRIADGEWKLTKRHLDLDLAY